MQVKPDNLGECAPSALLQVVGISKSFGTAKVLNTVDFQVSKGAIHGLIGQNGAGKSTLVGIISGVVAPDSGDIFLDGKRLKFGNPREALNAGIATVYQELSLIPELTVLQNMFLGDEIFKKRLLDTDLMAAQAKTLLSELGGVDIDPFRKTWNLSLAQQQLLEIARCMRRKMKVLILDEPSAVLGASELAALFELLTRLRSRGIGVIYISHRLAEVEEVSDEITVLRDGLLIEKQTRGSFNRSSLVNAMVGADIQRSDVSANVVSGMPLLSVRSLKIYPGDPHGTSFVISKGEILGVAGHTGSGRSRLLKSLCGIEKAYSGTVIYNGVEFPVKRLKRLRQLGVRYLPEDRKKYGLFSLREISHNMSISDISSYSWAGIVRKRKLIPALQALYDKVGIRATGLHQIVLRLSGGNQQKVVLARTMLSQPRILLLDEPLRGVDVGAKVEILDAIRRHVALGNAAIVVSTELADIIALTNRALIMKNGTMLQELQEVSLTENELALAVANS